MISFTNDYSEGCHPLILEAMTKTNTDINTGYSLDKHSNNARKLIKTACNCPNADVHFLVGGTQTNLTVISTFLRSFEAVISAETGHICVHETGAIEATGHKCIACPSTDGKLTSDMIYTAVTTHDNEHMVLPKMVYISNTTEMGTCYTTAELKTLRAVCDELGLLLFLDGARFGSALAAGTMTFADLGKLCDVFYIGGTKNGALMGEALVIVNPALQSNFRYSIKQHGGLLAKGWLLGIQFETLMQNNLYLELATHANNLALKLKKGIASLGYSFSADSISNQQFPILPDEIADIIAKKYGAMFIAKHGTTHSEMRLVTSWATKESSIDIFLADLKELTK